MNASEFKDVLCCLINEQNIGENNVRLIKSDKDRKACFNELDRIYFPVDSETICETLFSNDFSEYLILVYPDKIKSSEIFRASFTKEALKAVSEKEKYKKNKESGKLLLQILSDYINGRKTDVSALDDGVCSFAKKHEVDSFVFFQTKDNRLSNSYYKAIKRYSITKNLIETIKTEFNNSGIEYFFVKGGVIADYYPTPPLRTMGDCDIHLHSEDRPRASAILKKLGFEREIHDDISEWRFHNGKFVVELHECLYEDTRRTTEKEMELFRNDWDYVCNNKLNPEYHFVYVLYHLKKHLLLRGVGFRQFIDLVIMLKYCELDLDKTEKLCEKAGLKRFLFVCTSLCGKWFDVDLPFKTELTDDFVNKATFLILHNGVFGVGRIVDEDRMFSDLVNNDGKLKTIIFSIFLPYKAFTDSEGYSWLQGRPYLLPIAWIVRFYRKLMKPKEFKRGLRTVNKVSKTEKLKSEFYEWGL